MSIPSSNKIFDINPHTLGYANNDDITSFTDDAGVAWEYDTTKAKYKTSLQNGKDGFDFASGARLKTTGNIDLSSVSTVTVYAVVKNRATGLNTVYSFGVMSGGVGLYFSNVNGSTMEAGIVDSAGYRYKDFSERIATFQLFTLEADKSTNPDTLNLEVDTAAVTETTNGSNNFSGNFSSAKFYVGYATSVFSGGDFQLLRLLGYSVIHSGGERTQVEDEFATLYDLAYLTPPETDPPTVDIVSPADEADVTGTIDVDVECDDGAGSGVASLQLKVDGTNHGSAYTGSNITAHTFSLNTALLENGEHELTVFAEDAQGNSATSASITINVENPPVVDVDADDTSLIIGQAVTLTDNSINVDVYAVNWGDGNSGTDPNGSHSYSEAGSYTITITGTNDFGSNSFEINITVADADFDPFEILDHVKMLNLNGLGWSAPLIEANFGGGFGAGIIANQDYGLHRWTIASEFLPDHSYEIDANIDGETVTQKYFTYVFEFFKRHTLRGNKPFVIKEHRTGNYYLVRFAMGGAIDFGRLTAKFFTNEGIQVQEARTSLEGFTFAEDGSVTKS